MKATYKYDGRNKDFVATAQNSQDRNLLFYLFGNILRFNLTKYGSKKEMPFDTFNIKEELEKRGYDLKTLKFSIEKKDEK